MGTRHAWPHAHPWRPRRREPTCGPSPPPAPVPPRSCLPRPARSRPTRRCSAPEGCCRTCRWAAEALSCGRALPRPGPTLPRARSAGPPASPASGWPWGLWCGAAVARSQGRMDWCSTPALRRWARGRLRRGRCELRRPRLRLWARVCSPVESCGARSSPAAGTRDSPVGWSPTARAAACCSPLTSGGGCSRPRSLGAARWRAAHRLSGGGPRPLQ